MTKENENFDEIKFCELREKFFENRKLIKKTEEENNVIKHLLATKCKHEVVVGSEEDPSDFLKEDVRVCVSCGLTEIRNRMWIKLLNKPVKYYNKQTLFSWFTSLIKEDLISEMEGNHAIESILK